MSTDIRRLPLWKKILFSLVLAFLVVGFFVLLELGLRLVLPSLDNPLVQSIQYNGSDWHQINRQYLRKYFPSSIAILPELKPSVFRLQKTPSTFRVVCLGGSSMFGTPYQMTANIPGIVRKQLRSLYPDREIEVINLGASAINSNVVLDMAEDVAELAPDLVLIYMGHNEFYGPDGIGAPPIEQRFPWITRLKYDLRDFHLVALLTSWLSDEPESPGDPGRTLMREVSVGNTVRLNSPEAQRIEALFEDNLTSILKILGRNRIPVIMSDVTSNLFFPPFQSEHGSPSVPDSATAAFHFAAGMRLVSEGDGENAGAHLLLAKDLDLLKFRAPEAMNGVIRSVAGRQAVPLISADSVFRALSPLKIPGNSLFWEHLHPNVEGYYHIANLFVREIVRMGILPSAKEPHSAYIPYDLDSLSIAWLDLAYADLSMQNLTSHWPFTGQRTPLTVLQNEHSSLLQIARDVYATRMGWAEGCFSSASVLERIGRAGSALRTYQAMLEEFPYDLAVWYRLANLRKNLGLISHAVDAYERILGIDSLHVSSMIELGLLEVNRGNFDRSLSLLMRALRTDSGNNPSVTATIHYGLAGVYANKGDFASALKSLDESLRLNPSYTSALEFRSALLRGRETNP